MSVEIRRLGRERSLTPGDLRVEVLAVKERVDLDSCLCSVGEGTLGTLASSTQAAESAGVVGDVLLCLLEELLLEVLKEVGIKVLAAEMSVTSSSLHSEDTALDVEERHIKGATAKIINKDVALLVRLSSAKTVGNSGGGRLVDDTDDVEASDGTGVLGGLSLVVVEVGRDGDDGLLNLLGELGLGDLLHLWPIVRSCPITSECNSLRTLTRTMAEISWGEKVFCSPRYSTWTLGLPSSSTTLKGQDSMSFLTVGSSNLRPMRRLKRLSDVVLVCASCVPNSLDIEDGVDGVHGSLVLGGLTDQTLLSSEGNERRGGEGTLVVGDWKMALSAQARANSRDGCTY